MDIVRTNHSLPMSKAVNTHSQGGVDIFTMWWYNYKNAYEIRQGIMKLFAPEYYKKFNCIADKCKHSCCIGWEIDIDGKTMDKYAKCNGDYAETVLGSIEADNQPHFKLGENERCPHLNENGLCNIIIELGEDYLCHICREHPRFYNDTRRGREVGLGMACEEACRIILTSDDYDKICVLGEFAGEGCESEFDAIFHRERLFGILKNKSLSYAQKLKEIGNEYGLSIDSLSDGLWREVLSELEYLDASHKELFSAFSVDTKPDVAHEKALERALAYFVYRHCTEAWDMCEFRISLGLCLFCERLLASLTALENDILCLARIISEEIEYSEDNTESIKNVIFDII